MRYFDLSPVYHLRDRERDRERAGERAGTERRINIAETRRNISYTGINNSVSNQVARTRNVCVIYHFFLQTTARRVHRYGATVPSSISFTPLSFSLFLSLSSSLPCISPCSPFGIARTFTSLLSLLPHSPFSLSFSPPPTLSPPLSPSPSFSSPLSGHSLSLFLSPCLSRQTTHARGTALFSGSRQDRGQSARRAATRVALLHIRADDSGPSSGDTCACELRPRGTATFVLRFVSPLSDDGPDEVERIADSVNVVYVG